MDSDRKLSEQIQTIQDVAKENKNVDVSALMMAALERHEQNTVSSKAKRWAYLVSIGAPPLGLLFALKYYFDDKDDAKQVAYMCIGLTAFSLILLIITIKLMFNGAGTSLDKIQQIKPSDVMQLTQ